ncbi:MAG: T9SS C-terminal target domain-containing protein, partial [Bacteroidota bacterium]
MHNLRPYVLLFSFALIFTGLQAQSQEVRSFMFGHSLMDHRPAGESSRYETTIAYWIHQLAQAGGHSYTATGRFGDLFGQSNNLPPTPDWYYAQAPATSWDDNATNFGGADFNKIIFTELNYVQWQGPTDTYWNSDTETPVTAAERLVEWVDAQEPGVDIYLYENWPEMSDYPLSAPALADYHATTQGSWHDWWVTYQDEILAVTPEQNLKMIPLGPIISKLMTEAPLNQIP